MVYMHISQLIPVFIVISNLPQEIYMFRMVHTKCRSTYYPVDNIKRLLLSDEQVPWDVKFEYEPPEFNSKLLNNKPWADPSIDDPTFSPKFNSIDGKVNRVSYSRTYDVVHKRPLNPEGRTGLKGRGILGRWGPNHAADPIVTRWKIIDGVKEIKSSSKLPVLQFCAIQRRDSGQWAIPGGMVDSGEAVSETLKREFLEEAFNSLESNSKELEVNKDIVSKFFECGTEIYKGYVDDPRNTDNAWIETVAMNFHDETGDSVGKFKLQAGDDAKHVTWMDINRNLDLYASHAKFIEKVVRLRNAHW